MKRVQNTGTLRALRKQGGATLFVALIALVTIMLAAVSLIRSSDTSTVIAGNLAFKQAATAAGDSGLESAMAALTALNTANSTKNPFTDLSHGFNLTVLANGYYSNFDPALDMTASTTWANNNSVGIATDAGGNQVRYIIQRMCRTANQLLSESDCLFSDDQSDTDSHIGGKQTAIKGGKNALNRVTVRVVGPRNTVSYIQAFIY